MRKLNLIVLFVTVLVANLQIGCKKKEVEPTTTPTTVDPEANIKDSGSIILNINHYIETNKIIRNQTFTTSSGRQISVSGLRFFISSIDYVRESGKVITVKKVSEFNLDVSGNFMGKVPVGKYKNIRFKVGLTPEFNEMLPDESIAYYNILNNKYNWFESTAQRNKYIFFRLNGSIDTSAVPSNSLNGSFDVKVGMNENLITVSMPEKLFTVTVDEFEYLQFNANYSTIFEGITLNQSQNINITKDDQAGTAIQKIKVNIPKLFSWK